MTDQTQQHTSHALNSEALDLNKIMAALGWQDEFANRINLFPEIGSTNTFLFEYENTESIHGRVCITDFQSAGRGRRGREWISSQGKNLTLSIAWNFGGDIQALSGLSLAVGVMLANCFSENEIAQIKLKWPNDLYFNDKKVGGILVETVNSAAGVTRAVIGVGLNVDTDTKSSRKDPEKIDQPWASLSLADKNLDRSHLAALVIEALRSGLRQFAQLGLEAYAADWRKLHAFTGKRVTIEQGGDRLTGIVNDIASDGALLLQTDTGETKRIMSGEINSSVSDDESAGACLRLVP